METPDNWRKSSHSGPGDGDSCVEIANDLTRVAIRDSKDPSCGTLLFPTGTFAAFVETLKADSVV
ncbi:DUF397 domain-containing protein [Streptomyces sp. AC555_RSS877]|uniref:DUF397 domain-containing protein n=1 Tax=Streptomyces sp. AC555_RSS877 TaxID=2823688 RepID=UPI001C2804A5|nr:DUF397 domain-containing protein [Streptomyces sp. AC555_RSS877]